MMVAGGEVGIGSPLSSALVISSAHLVEELICQDLIAIRTWTSKRMNSHVNILEMKAVQLALSAFLHRIIGQTLMRVLPRWWRM